LDTRPTIDTPLHQAAGQVDPDALLRLLADDKEFDARADTHYGPYDPAKRDLTPLMVAAGSAQGSARAVVALLAHGADAHAPSAAGAASLWYAAAAGDPERVQVLLNAGGTPNSTIIDGCSAVTMAAEAVSAEAFRLLLRAGASPHPPGVLADYASAEGRIGFSRSSPPRWPATPRVSSS